MAVTETRHTRYEPNQFEAKWQDRWEDEALYRAEDFLPKPKYYLLNFFPYPSGAGLSVGHSKNYVPTDVMARYMRMRGYNVLFPMGWDAFGLPAENEAILRQVPPQENTARNVANYKRQLKLQGTSFDWTREINASHPDYYRWTQWFFLMMLRKGLAYRATGLQWWCPQCKTILANEQVVNGYCWRHTDQPVERKELEQWYFRITDYADELLESLDDLDWPERIILMQRNWIGRSTGAEITFTARDSAGNSYPIPVFTTRPDTIYGATFLVLSPEHPLVDVLASPEQRGDVMQYQQRAARETEIQRLSTERDKTGVFVGAFATNPMTGEEMPIWIADYVLMGYGTGAIMAVPAHDQRDFEFAARYHLPVREVIEGPPGAPGGEGAYAGPGTVVNSGPFDGLDADEAKEAITAALTEKGVGHAAVTYRLRDWLVSRQRYWGAPIPIVYCDTCGMVPVPEDQLPVLLPPLEHFAPGEDGRSPLANDPNFVNTACPACGGPARRETDTLDTFVDSSWYYLRFASPHEVDAPFDADAARYWAPIDLYVGGAEHAVMHLLYFRFFTKVMADAGLVPFREPAPRLRNQGTMHGANGARMSKSKGNVVTPDSVVAEYGADSLRAYICFIGPFEADAFWDPTGINGVHRWLSRVWDMAQPMAVDREAGEPEELELRRAINKTIKRVTADLEGFQFNTAVSTLMELSNLMQRLRPALERAEVWRWATDQMLLIMAPLTPYISEELWSRRGGGESIHRQAWPEYDEVMTIDEVKTIVVQVNGKVRDRLEVPQSEDMESVREQALSSPKVQPYLAGKEVAKVVVVLDKLVNIVVR
ncbi:MAG TPA: leucine--tRNA ligase [Chloroflexota bacterium]|nr:leucine--tRNA ligase [Chloroflexota bacterium]